MPSMPALFIGHGNPMHAISNNQYTDAWSRLGREIRRPTAILAVSAHWFVPMTGVTITTAPRTIHDFGGFPRELYQVRYPAPGSPELARRVQSLLAPLPVTLDESWGLDHGTWAVLRHMYPEADVPAVQLSIDASRPAEFHYEIGRQLAVLRGENVLVLGSGNLIHNLRLVDWSFTTQGFYDWAGRFEETARGMIAAGEHRSLMEYEKLGKDARLAVPTPEHYFPLMHILGTRQRGDGVSFPVAGADGGSISMLAVQMG
jgi:4,5-DOPA dioxygenase extradiol